MLGIKAVEEGELARKKADKGKGNKNPGAVKNNQSHQM
jgi:hypothetical protein